MVECLTLNQEIIGFDSRRRSQIQTFLPYPDFQESARALDYQRLGKQRVEAQQILNALRGQTSGWVNHPATRMWRGYEVALEQYLRAMILEWVGRGYKNTMNIPEAVAEYVLPPWVGDEAFHASHRSNLLRKKPDYYAARGWTDPDNLPYVWPGGA